MSRILCFVLSISLSPWLLAQTTNKPALKVPPVPPKFTGTTNLAPAQSPATQPPAPGTQAPANKPASPFDSLAPAPVQPPPAPPNQPDAARPIIMRAPTPKFELLDNDRVVFFGDTFIEREQTYGYIETRLTTAFPDRNITFRNLGWSADTVLGVSRAGFDPPEKGFDRLKEQIAAVKPTVAFLGYGMASSFDGEAAIPNFKQDLNRLIDTIQSVSKDCRFVLMSPVPHEHLPPPLPDPTEHNRVLGEYAKTIREVAQDRKLHFIPLFERLLGGMRGRHPRRFTDNGIHLNDYGYWWAADIIERGLGLEPNIWRLGVGADGSVRNGSMGLEATEINKKPDRLTFNGLFKRVPNPPIPGLEGKPVQDTLTRLQVAGFDPGKYTLKIDGRPVITLTEQEWFEAPVLDRGPHIEQLQKLRQAIQRKNELFFHRWRPQNNTYLFGFRKHEQGQNAKEIEQFDPLIAEQEKLIADLRKPRPLRFEWMPADPDAPRFPEEIQELKEIKSSQTFAPRPRPEFELAEGFEISLFAENPLLAKPIQMNFDPQGRLWIASSSVYPQIKPGEQADDKIIVLEDADGDGRADKSSVFADGLLIPTGVEPGDGGVYVGQSTELLHFKDTNGDGKADEKRIVLSGFGTEDTHHILHTLRWGHDGQLYFNQSIYIHSHIETPHGVVRLNSGGIFHLRPPTMELGIFLKGFCNPWGHAFDHYGQSFVTDGAGFQGISYGVPGATYFTYAGMRRELRSVSPGSYPKFCGLEMIYSQHFPDDWQGNFVTPDFRAHRLVRFSIAEQGSAFVTKEMPDLLRTRDVSFRPVDVKLGPDGALYIADWSNPIIQHGEVDFRDPRRDREHGRIWRVSAKGRPPVPRPNLVKASNKELLDHLLSPNAFTRQQSRRVLTERGQAIAADLADWIKSHATEEAWMQALWMYQSIEVVQPGLIELLLEAKDGRIRAAAARVLAFWHARMPNASDLLAKAVADEHPRVRLEAVRALARIPTPRSAELVLSALDRPLDDFLDYGVWLSINDLARVWIDAIQSGAWKMEGREKQLEFGLQAIEPALASSVLTQLLEKKPITRDGAGPWIELIGKAGGQKELQMLFEKIVAAQLDASATARALTALTHAARVRNIKPPGDLAGITKILDHTNEKVRIEAVKLAGAWKEASAASTRLLAMAADGSASSGLRQALFDALRDIGGKTVVEGLKPLTAKSHPPALRRQAAVVLSALDPKSGIPEAVQVLAETDSEEAALGLWRALLSIKNSAGPIARALPRSGLPAEVGKAGLRAAREGGRNEPDLILSIARAAGLEEDSRNLTPAEIQQLVTTVTQKGDPVRGEKLYRRADLACVSCHAIGGVGGKVGPDLTSIGASAPVDYLIESLLYPNRKIKEGYHGVLVETKDGQEYSGVLVRETNEQLVLRDATDKEIAIPKNNVGNKATSGSLMPSGLLDTLAAEEQADLLRFLAELGKPGRFDASKGNVARLWRVRAGSHDLEQFGEDKLVSGDVNGPEWAPVRTFVDGTLSREDLKEGARASRYVGVVGLYAAAKIQVPKQGHVRLALSGANNPSVWINGKPLAAKNEIQTELEAGVHTVVVKLDARNLPEQIRLETSDGTFLAN
ncbi:MAG: PVC-type heme-binding CxxCH protein [Verrucomicrobiota bacterium]